jgi:anaerobic magnesium-protoporphyrin IX monomethyl ester cyclase
VKVALVNPPWVFDRSIYFGCREPHLPLEYGYARQLLLSRGHDARLFDAQLMGQDIHALTRDVEAFRPDVTVLTTAPSYLFWRCAPPELRVPLYTAQALRPFTERLVVVGPHASTTPRAVLSKLGADVAILGECETVLAEVVESEARDYHKLSSVAFFESAGGHRRGRREAVRIQGLPATTELWSLPALGWQKRELDAHRHHHHRFDREPLGPGAEIEASRGCPYSCTFCAKENFRNRYRKRPLSTVLQEIDCLIAAGVQYLYFIDEIFLPDEELLQAMSERPIAFGVQLRIDHWSPSTLELLGAAGCVSVEAGIESITPGGRSLLQKHCRQSTEELTEQLIAAKRHIPFVQANLIGSGDRNSEVMAWRALLAKHGVWSNEPLPLFAYPGSPEYRLKWGALDDYAWERAHAQYLGDSADYSKKQHQSPLPLEELERMPLETRRSIVLARGCGHSGLHA